MPRLSFSLGSSNASDPLLPFVLSILLASVLTVYPIPYDWVNYRPMWMMLITLFWVLAQPKWCGVWFAFLMGVACDLMVDTLLGEHAFSFVLLAFLSRYLLQNRRILTFSNLWMISAAACLAHLIVMFIVQKLAGHDLSLAHWATWFPSVLVWPVIYLGLKRWHV